MALEGATNAAATANNGAPVVMNLANLLVTYLQVVASLGIGFVAPRQGRILAQQWSRNPGGALRNIARINYGGM